MGFVFNLVFVYLMLTVSNVQCVSSKCRNKVMDIYFIMDASSSINSEDYYKVLKSVRDVVVRLDIGENKTRVGALAYSKRVHMQPEPLILNKFTNALDIKNYITTINFPYLSSLSFTHHAIRYARQSAGFREGITKVLVVITDGLSSYPDLTAQEADLARKQGFYIFVLGVSKYHDETEWAAIGSDPDGNFVYNVTDLRFLDRTRTSLLRSACALRPLKTCIVRKTDLASIYYTGASSNSQYLGLLVGKALFENTVGATNNIAVSYVFEGCDANYNVPFSSGDTHCSGVNKNTTIPIPALIRQVDVAAREQRMSKGDHNQIAVVLVDDTIKSESKNVAQAIREIENNGVEVILLHVTNPEANVNFGHFVAQQSKNYVQLKNNNDLSLEKNIQVLVDLICQATSRPPEDFSIDIN